ncbi:MAG: peptide-methionine (S)-S-oxide reductase MsrA [Paracoccaceae bacterium]
MRIFAIMLLVLSTLTTSAYAKTLQTAIFAGGCFWCVESDFDKVEGVVETTSGYTGGTVANATYKQVTRGGTGHYEAVRIVFDADITSYDQLLYVFWRTVDPTDAGGQFCDRGDSYRTAIFATDAGQAASAKASKAALNGRLSGPIVTPILAASDFWEAEGYHQNYHNTNSLKYGFYRSRCGRDARVKDLWGDEAIFAH